MTTLPSKLNRRQMLANTARAAAAVALSSSFAPLLAAPEKRRFQIAACDWSIGKNDHTSFELAKRLGLEGVEVELGSAASGVKLRRLEVQKAYLEAANKNGVRIASLAAGVFNEVPLKSEPRAAVWLLDSLDVCRALGVKVVLLACFGNGELKGDKPGIKRVVELFKEVAPRAEKAGVILGFENYLSAEENLEVIEQVKSPALQVYYDVGNSTHMGYDIYKEIPLLGKRICQFHFKDEESVLGKGKIDFAKARDAIDAIGYTGWLVLESAAPNGLEVDYPATIKYLRTLFS